MAPEQLEGAETDARTDIFALASEGQSKTGLIVAILQTQPAPISSVPPAVPDRGSHGYGCESTFQ